MRKLIPCFTSLFLAGLLVFMTGCAKDKTPESESIPYEETQALSETGQAEAYPEQEILSEEPAVPEEETVPAETAPADEVISAETEEIPEEPAAPVYTVDDLKVLKDEGLYSYADMVRDGEILLSLYPEYLTMDSLGTTADGREILHFIVGNPDAPVRVLINAGTHGREYITSQLVMKQMAVYLSHCREGINFGEYDYRDMWNRCAIHVVPMVNPDGISISQYGLAGIQTEEVLSGIYNIAAMDGSDLSQTYLDRWKANASGVDVNRNFDAFWEEYNDGLGHPSADHYKGEFPGSTPEAGALISLTAASGFSRTISYHAQGQLVYWNFANIEPIYDKALAFANDISSVTGYPLESNYSTVDPAGYSDWGIYRCQIPSLTVEVGSGTCPYIQDQFPQIWAENINVWEVTVISALRY